MMISILTMPTVVRGAAAGTVVTTSVLVAWADSVVVDFAAKR
jgi:hypothetical protein